MRKKYRRPPKVASLQILQEALDGHETAGADV